MASDKTFIAWYGWRNSDGIWREDVSSCKCKLMIISILFLLLFGETSLFWHSISFRMWVSAGFGSGRAYIKTPTHAFAVYWWSWDHPCHMPFLWIYHSNRSCQISNWCRNWWRYKGKCIVPSVCYMKAKL